MATELQNITFEQLLEVVIVVAILIGVYNLIISAIKNYREERKIKNTPIDKINDKLAFHDKCLENDKLRLEALERTEEEFRKNNANRDRCMNVIMRGQLAMLRHMQHGNNVDGMKASENELTDYLTGKEN